MTSAAIDHQSSYQSAPPQFGIESLATTRDALVLEFPIVSTLSEGSRAARVPDGQGRVSASSRYWLGGREILRPVAGDVMIAGGCITVTEPATGIFGAGNDLASALRDFRQALVDHLRTLAADDNLAPDLAAQLAYLRERISTERL